jgi:hypothetical protein
VSQDCLALIQQAQKKLNQPSSAESCDQTQLNTIWYFQQHLKSCWRELLKMALKEMASTHRGKPVGERYVEAELSGYGAMLVLKVVR